MCNGRGGSGIESGRRSGQPPDVRGPKGTRVDVHLAVTPPDFLTSLWNWLFGAASGPCQDEFVCGRPNSPVIDGAAIVTFEPLGTAKLMSSAPTHAGVRLRVAEVTQQATAPGFLTSLRGDGARRHGSPARRLRLRHERASGAHDDGPPCVCEGHRVDRTFERKLGDRFRQERSKPSS